MVLNKFQINLLIHNYTVTMVVLDRGRDMYFLGFFNIFIYYGKGINLHGIYIIKVNG